MVSSAVRLVVNKPRYISISVPWLTAEYLVQYGIHNLTLGDAFAAKEKYGKELSAEQLAHIALGSA